MEMRINEISWMILHTLWYTVLFIFLQVWQIGCSVPLKPMLDLCLKRKHEMNCAIVYFSLTGHVGFLVQEMQKLLPCDLCELKVKRPYPDHGFLKFYRAGRDASLRWKVALQTPLPSLEKYDSVIVCSPVWAGRVCSPMYSFLSRSDLRDKHIYLIASSSGGDTAKFFTSIKKLVGLSSVKGEISFIDPNQGTWDDEQQKRLSVFCKQIQLHG